MLTCLFLALVAHAIGRRFSPRQRRPWRLKRLSGFSLIELTVVLLVMGIGATIALPRLAETVSRNRAETVAKVIQSDLELARRTAMNRGRVVTMRFDLENAQYQSAEVVAHPGHSETLEMNLPAAFGQNIHLSADFAGPTGIQFDPRGTPSMTGPLGDSRATGTITVSMDGATLHLQIRPSMSLVSLETDD